MMEKKIFKALQNWCVYVSGLVCVSFFAVKALQKAVCVCVRAGVCILFCCQCVSRLKGGARHKED